MSQIFLYTQRYDKGTSLSFDDVEDAQIAKLVYNKFVEKLKSEYQNVITGEYQSHMDIQSIATGPVNVILEF